MKRLIITLLLASVCNGQLYLSEFTSTEKPPLGSSLVVQNRLAGSWLFNEGIGGVVYDTSGNQNDGIASGSPTWVTGMNGHAIEFDGGASTDSFNCGENESLDIVGAISIAAWVKYNSEADRYIIAKRNDGAQQYALYVDAEGDLELLGWGADPSVEGGVLPAGEWAFCVGVCHGDGTGSTYLDGVETTTDSTMTAITTASCDVYIGARGAGATTAFEFNGQIDSIQIYNTALSARDVRALYTDSFGQYRPDTLWYVIAAAIGNPWYYYIQN